MGEAAILLLEDDTALALGIEYTLAEEGFIVNKAATITEAKRVFDEKRPDLILADIMLPDGSGYDFLSYVRGKGDTPLIFLTACDEEVNVVMGLDMGADDYITKPFRAKELAARIRSLLRRKGGGGRTREYISEGISVNMAKAKAYKDGMELNLTAQEFRLICGMMTNSGNILPREYILEALWDKNFQFVDDNTLSVYIRRLREKVEENPETPELIKTIRGVGYMWDKPVREV
jgi:DNA-binding response OmpR family regulator